MITTRSRRRLQTAEHGLHLLDALRTLTEGQPLTPTVYLITPTGYPARDHLQANDIIGRNV